MGRQPARTLLQCLVPSHGSGEPISVTVFGSAAGPPKGGLNNPVSPIRPYRRPAPRGSSPFQVPPCRDLDNHVRGLQTKLSYGRPPGMSRDFLAPDPFCAPLARMKCEAKALEGSATMRTLATGRLAVLLTAMSATIMTRAADTAPAPTGLAAEVEQLRSQLKALQVEFFRFQADSLQRTITALETEAARAQNRLRRLEREEALLRDEITAAALRATQPQSPAERQEMETIAGNREMRPGSDLVRVLEEKDALGRRVDELQNQVQTERRRSQVALKALARLQPDLARAQ